MTTFTIQINDDDADMVLAILKKFKAKVIKSPDKSSLTYEIAEALKEVKQIQEGSIEPLTLKDI